MTLVHKAQLEPARLAPSDLAPLRELVGAGALDHALVLCSFHCITRLADLLGAKPEAPAPLRRVEALRRMVIRVGGLWLRFVGMAGQSYTNSYEQALEDIRPVFDQAHGRPPDDELESLRLRPQLVESIQRLLEEQIHRSSLPRETLSLVHRIVEEKLLPNDDSASSDRDRKFSIAGPISFVRA